MQFLPTAKYQFDEFQLDVPKRQLLRAGEIVELKPKAFDLLLVLATNSGVILSKDDLFRLVWQDQIVEESNLTVHISQIRKALGEKAIQPRFITTISGQGYCFIETVRELVDEEGEFVLESQAIARVTIEDFDDNTVKTTRLLQHLSHKKHRVILICSTLALVSFLGIAGYLWQNSRVKNPVSFSNITMKRLTNLGNVNNAALSPDGKLFAYALQEKNGWQSLWLGQIDGGRENLQLRPPAEVVYLGINFTPDGTNLFYNLSGKGLERNTIFKMAVLGGLPEKIHENVISFSPDGKRFASQ